MKAVVFSNISARELNGKFVRLVNDAGLSLERVLPCKRAGDAELNAEFVIATVEGTTDSERQSVDRAAKAWGKRAHWVTLRASHSGWEMLKSAVQSASGERASQVAKETEDWQRLAEKYAEENDALRAREQAREKELSALRSKLRDLEAGASQRRADRERVEELSGELDTAKSEAASLRKRLADAIDARRSAEARIMTPPPTSRADVTDKSSPLVHLNALVEAGLMTEAEAFNRLRRSA